MTNILRICLAQLDFKVADLSHNTNKIIQAIQAAQTKHQADLIVFPELTLTSYPPEDLLLRQDFYRAISQALTKIRKHTNDIAVILGFPEIEKDQCFNTAAFIYQGKVLAKYHKQCLPNYGVFDEVRYFTPGKESAVVNLKGVKLGLLICEDIWNEGPSIQLKQTGAEVIISINASPFSIEKHARRINTITERQQSCQLPFVYVNHVGGQDDLLFDGSSFAINKGGKLCLQAPAFQEILSCVDYSLESKELLPSEIHTQDTLATVYQGLVIGVRDYINKNGFPGVVIGLSGGIDSALTLAIATDALGSERVQAVMMPSQYTADISQSDAAQQASLLGVDYQVISISSIFNEFSTQLAPLFAGLAKDTTEENLQSRIRGTLLMAISNKTGKLVLTTGNKSEMAVGYATLYGDMAGGFAVLKDIYKTMVYQLSSYRNSLSPNIPQRVIDRPPSAELAPDQLDQDSLPPYEELDPIIDCFVEKDLGIDAIVAKGFSSATVKKVLKLIHLSEYKRRQAPPGPKVTRRAFGRNRRYPITSGFLSLLS